MSTSDFTPAIASRLIGRQCVITATMFVLVFVVSAGSIELAKGDLLIAGFWPANALALIAILRFRSNRRLRWHVWIAVFAAIFSANFVCGAGWRNSLIFMAGNAAEIAIAYLIMRANFVGYFARESASSIMRIVRPLALAAIVAPAVGAAIGAVGLSFADVQPLGHVWLGWWLPSALGLLVVVPFGLLVTRDEFASLSNSRGMRDLAIGALIIAAVLTSALVFHRLTLVLLATPLVLAAALRRGPLGAALAIAAIALTTIPLAASSIGATISTLSDAGERLVQVQIALLTIGLTALVLAGITRERDGILLALDRQRLEASEMAQARLRLLLSVAHEIRTPLSVIQGCNEMLAKPGDLTSPQRGLIEAATAASRELQTLANDLLETARTEHGHLAVQPVWFTPQTILQQVVAQSIAASVSAHPPVITIDAASGVFADPQRFRQVAQNLISNAAKYAGSYGPTRVSVRQTATAVILAVCDQGPGVPLGGERAIFEPFTSHSKPVTSTSAGFGLSVVKQLVEAHGGSVSCTSVPFIETRIEASFPLPGAAGRPALASKNLDSIDPASLFGV